MKTQYWLILAAVLTAGVLMTKRHVPAVTSIAFPTDVSVPAPITAFAKPSGAPALPAASITPGRLYTADDVLNLDAMGDDRVEALYRLTQAGPRAAADLKRIVGTALPKDLTRRALEVSIRITALEALDHLAEQGVDVKDSFAQALALHQEGALQTIALIGLRGIEEGRPGKIKRFIDEMVN